MFYTKYNADIVNQQQNAISFDMYKNCLQVLLYDSQLSYISLQVSELQDKLEIEQAKFFLGYTTSISVDDINSKLLSKQTEYDTVYKAPESRPPPAKSFLRQAPFHEAERRWLRRRLPAPPAHRAKCRFANACRSRHIGAGCFYLSSYFAPAFKALPSIL